MKVKDVIEALKNCDPEATVFVGEDTVEFGIYEPCSTVARIDLCKASYLYGEGIFRTKSVSRGRVIETFTGVVIE